MATGDLMLIDETSLDQMLIDESGAPAGPTIRRGLSTIEAGGTMHTIEQGSI